MAETMISMLPDSAKKILVEGTFHNPHIIKMAVEGTPSRPDLKSNKMWLASVLHQYAEKVPR